MESLQELLHQKYKTRVSPFSKKIIQSSPLADGLKIARQLYPSLKELNTNVEYKADPLNEDDTDIQSTPNVIHKYPQKILIITTGECPVYCRYCTRKRKTLMREEPEEINYEQVDLYLKKNPQIREVILSGGDPFMLSTTRLQYLSEFFLKREQIQFFRYHTRTPTMLPSRFNEDLLSTLEGLKNNYNTIQAFVLHINHTSELTPESEMIIKTLIRFGYYVYSQSVLLRRVNDDAQTLADLCIRLKSIGVQPYYLHHLDKVEGAEHFLVSLEEGQAIVHTLRQLIPPYMMPRYVKDSKQGKINLFY